MDLYDQLPTSSLVHSPEFLPLLEAARNNCVSVLEFLTLDPSDLAKLVPRSTNDIAKFQHLLKREYRAHLSTTRTCHVPLSFTTGDAEVDRLLGGGVFTGNITEVFGESSTGKSQFLMQLSLSVQLPRSQGGLQGKCVFVTTEGDLPTQRLDEMIRSRRDLFGDSALVSQDNIYCVSCNDLDNQEHILNVQLPILLERNNDVKLVIVDSISHHLRVELETKSLKNSQDNRFYIDRIAQNLLKLANEHSVAVVVANQVADKPLAPESSSTVRHGIMDYDYQLGWIVGWKDSSIYYRHVCADPAAGSITTPAHMKKVSHGPANRDDILSEDEDYSLVAQVTSCMNRLRHTTPFSNAPRANSPSPLRKGNMSASTFTKKRKIDTKVPNLGLTWANHVTTRILFQKSYKASPMIKSGEFDLNKVTDTSLFWQARRTMKLIFSTFAKPDQMQYMITTRGIESIEEQ